MATAAQIAANCRNARKSTGPKTEQGKQKSSRNAVKHGLLAAVIPAETEGWKELLTSLYESLRPQDELQRFLVEQVAHSMLRLRRSAAFEEKYLEQGRSVHFPLGFVYVSEDGKPPVEPVTVSQVARIAGFLDSPPGHLLLRYETAANRQIKRNLELLAKLQAASRHKDKPACPYLTEPAHLEGAAPSAPLPSDPPTPAQPGSPGLPVLQPRHLWPGQITPGHVGPGRATVTPGIEGREALASFRNGGVNGIYNGTEKNGG
jgi:hypothetical protein